MKFGSYMHLSKVTHLFSSNANEILVSYVTCSCMSYFVHFFQFLDMYLWNHKPEIIHISYIVYYVFLSGVWRLQCHWALLFNIEIFLQTKVGLLVVFNVPSTARSFRGGTPIYCPLWRTWSSINTPFRSGIEPQAVAWQSITLLLRYASSKKNPKQIER